jgi:uncharacterized NAD(P)/FAD-binding protein YdhS
MTKHNKSPKINQKPQSLLTLFKEVRREMETATASGLNWRLIIDAIRPTVPHLWGQLSLKDRKKFFRHLFTLWNKHRHRMSPEGQSLLEDLQNQGRLIILAGKVVEIDNTHTQYLRVHTALRKDPNEQLWDVQHVLNCTGPDYRITKQNNHLLNTLHEKGFITWDPLEMGLETTPELALKGKIPGKIYALGSLLFGERLETTAVPEIRQQAVDIAEKILRGAP